jgi:hypothetical protein
MRGFRLREAFNGSPCQHAHVTFVGFTTPARASVTMRKRSTARNVWVIENNGAENRCKRSTPSRKCLTFCEKRLPVAEWAHMRLQKSPAKAKTYATIFAKVWQQPIEPYAVVP